MLDHVEMGAKTTTLTNRLLAEFHRRLHAWYAAHGRRDLPWRNTSDPYHIYLSEVMLQQTQVATVLERYYFPFLKRFPSLKALAEAPREDVLKAWQGLGYYNRAANLHKAAQVSPHPLSAKRSASLSRMRERVRERALIEELLKLPGIGRNTAHAVAAFAFRQPVPVMEANVKRVLHRIFALQQSSEPELWRAAETLLDRQNPFDYNQAMMDIGATVCTKRNPKCGECPANIICQGKTAPELYPAPRAKKQTPVREKIIVVLRDASGHYFAEPRTERFLHGMYQFTEMEKAPKGARHLGHVTQAYSHFTLEADIYIMETGRKELGNLWFTLEELQRLPHSKAEEKILAMLSQSRCAPVRLRARSRGGRRGLLPSAS